MTLLPRFDDGNNNPKQDGRYRRVHYLLLLMGWLALLFVTPLANSAETICARVKIEIKQELTLERQAFDAQMTVNNTTADGVISNVSVVVNVTDENGTPVAVTDNPNDTNAKFFIKVSNKQNINDVSGNGSISPATSAVINWLLIPAPGSAGENPLGKKYLVGATLKYTFAGADTTLDVSPDVITVKPLPLLTLDYFLTQNVWGDDPLTAVVEPIEPFTLGVRVKNDGFATAKSLKIDSAQPKIIENNQGLLINFSLTGSYVDDQPVQNTLLADFGDIPAATGKMGRWVMESSLAGKFTEFTAKFSHADELGGSLTSIMKATNPHFLIRDVQVDLPGRDNIRDFLAQDSGGIKVYESNGPDTSVTDRSGVTSLTPVNSAATQVNYKFAMPATDGFVYVKLADPYNGTKEVGSLLRSDGKRIAPANIWLSKTRNEQTKQWQYWVNLFDVNTPGSYDAVFQTPANIARAPALQAIADKQVQETHQVSFIVEASSPQGIPVNITAAPLPQGATFVMEPADPAAPGLARAVFDWTPNKGQAGDYTLTYTASDGTLSSKATATILVSAYTPPPGPATPAIQMPLSGAQVAKLKPILSVQTGETADDTTSHVQYEVYSDEAMTHLVASAQVERPAAVDVNGTPTVPPTNWTLPNSLNDNSHYWWRVRAYEATRNIYSPWVDAHFFVNLFNDAPNSFNLTSPDPETEVDTLTPLLVWNNSHDKDGDTVVYDARIFKDAGLTEMIAEKTGIAEDESGSTRWQTTTALVNHQLYYWEVLAKDSLGAQTSSMARPFTVNTGNAAPTEPVIESPALDGESTTPVTTLTIHNSQDADNDALNYGFEIDTVNTFDSANKDSSGPVPQGSGGLTSWTTNQLTENTQYWWRVKAQDGRADSAWVVGHFLMNAHNDAPPAPTVNNPGNGAWVSVLQPSLEANPVLDPEGGEVKYQFEVYRNAGLSDKVAEVTTVHTSALVPVPLNDKTTYWWRVRAVDPLNLAGPWSPAAVMYVSTGPYQAPTIAVTEPAVPTTPKTVRTANGARQQVTIQWEGTDQNIEPVVALYYDTQPTGYGGSLIVDGLVQPAGVQTGSYVWDVTGLASGTYYIYATISDAGGTGKAYAPSAFVIPKQPQTGSVLVTLGANMTTSESGTTRTFSMRLGSAPIANVTLPLYSTNAWEGNPVTASLTFTPSNWSTNQTVTVKPVDDCEPDGNKIYNVVQGKAISLDPNYIGITGAFAKLTNADNGDLANTTNSASIHICSMTIITQKQINSTLWEYTLSAKMTNTDLSLTSLEAQLTQVPIGIQIIDGNLSFGVSRQGETIVSTDTVTLRSPTQIQATTFKQGLGYKWNVTPIP